MFADFFEASQHTGIFILSSAFHNALHTVGHAATELYQWISVFLGSDVPDEV